MEWQINPIDPEEGERFYMVVGTSQGDEIRFCVAGWNCEANARELRDALNRNGRAVTTWALPA